MFHEFTWYEFQNVSNSGRDKNNFLLTGCSHSNLQRTAFLTQWSRLTSMAGKCHHLWLHPAFCLSCLKGLRVWLWPSSPGDASGFVAGMRHQPLGASSAVRQENCGDVGTPETPCKKHVLQHVPWGGTSENRRSWKPWFSIINYIILDDLGYHNFGQMVKLAFQSLLLRSQLAEVRCDRACWACGRTWKMWPCEIFTPSMKGVNWWLDPNYVTM